MIEYSNEEESDINATVFMCSNCFASHKYARDRELQLASNCECCNRPMADGFSLEESISTGYFRSLHDAYIASRRNFNAEIANAFIEEMLLYVDNYQNVRTISDCESLTQMAQDSLKDYVYRRTNIEMDDTVTTYAARSIFIMAVYRSQNCRYITDVLMFNDLFDRAIAEI